MVTAIYDGYCVICNQTRRTVMALDWFHRVEFLNIHNWNEVNSCWGFFGRDPRENGMAEHLDEELIELAAKAEVEYLH